MVVEGRATLRIASIIAFASSVVKSFVILTNGTVGELIGFAVAPARISNVIGKH